VYFLCLKANFGKLRDAKLKGLIFGCASQLPKAIKTCGENCNGSKNCSKKLYHGLVSFPLTLSFQDDELRVFFC
jgi:hypothetical protein